MNTVITVPYELIVSKETRCPTPPSLNMICLFLEPENFPREIPQKLMPIGRVPLKKIAGRFHSPSRFSGMSLLFDIIDTVLSNQIFYPQGLMFFDQFFTHSFRVKALHGHFKKSLHEIFLSISKNGLNESYEEFLKLFATITGLITGMSIFEADENFSSILNDVDRIVKKDSLLHIS